MRLYEHFPVCAFVCVPVTFLPVHVLCVCLYERLRVHVSACVRLYATVRLC